MHEIAKHEFLSWVDTLETENLTEHEITMLSILISNFEDIASVGAASGQRAKLLGKKIADLNNNVEKELPKYEINEVAESDVERLENLDVEKFRGFGTAQNFTFEKQYTFFTDRMGLEKQVFVKLLSIACWDR